MAKQLLCLFLLHDTRRSGIPAFAHVGRNARQGDEGTAQPCELNWIVQGMARLWRPIYRAAMISSPEIEQATLMPALFRRR